MKIETLLNFQYYSPATNFCVRATEYTEREAGGTVWRVSVVDNHTHALQAPNSRAEAIYLAEAKLKGFLERLKLTYGD
jgi:hypothetical protein